MKVALITVVALAVLTAGCKTYRTRRYVVVQTHRVQIVSPRTGDLSDTLAIEVFRSVADKLALPIRGPIQDPRTPQMFEYIAEPYAVKVWPTNTIWLTLMTHKDETFFISKIYGTRDDLSRAEEAASLITRALDEHGVRYKLVKGREPLFWGP